MRKLIFIICIVSLFMGIHMSASNLLNAQSVSHSSPLPVVDDETDSPNYFLGGLCFVVGLILLWLLFHKLIYPIFLKYYSPSYCKKLFWSLIMLYGLGWIAIGSYVIFDIGFRISSMKWLFVFVGILWIIWFIVIMLKKDRA